MPDVYFKRLVVYNCYSISALDHEFDTDCNVLVGPSGYGKSRILQTIVAAFFTINHEMNEIGLNNAIRMKGRRQGTTSFAVLEIELLHQTYCCGFCNKKGADSLFKIFQKKTDDIPTLQSDTQDTAVWSSNVRKLFDDPNRTNEDYWLSTLLSPLEIISYLSQDHGHLTKLGKLGISSEKCEKTLTDEIKNREQFNRELFRLCGIQCDFDAKSKQDSGRGPTFYFNDPNAGKNLDIIFPNLSGGQRQAVLTLAALHVDAKIVILDEPAQNLGTSTRVELRRLLHQHAEKRQIFIVTHSIEMVDIWKFPHHLRRVCFSINDNNRPNSQIIRLSDQFSGSKQKISIFRNCLLNKNISSLLFSKNVILVEGYMDYKIFSLLLDIWSKHVKLTGNYRILFCDGCENVDSALQLAQKLGCNALSFRDSDVLFEQGKNWKQYYTLEKGNQKKADPSLSDYLRRLGGHSVTNLDRTDLTKKRLSAEGLDSVVSSDQYNKIKEYLNEKVREFGMQSRSQDVLKLLQNPENIPVGKELKTEAERIASFENLIQNNEGVKAMRELISSEDRFCLEVYPHLYNAKGRKILKIEKEKEHRVVVRHFDEKIFSCIGQRKSSFILPLCVADIEGFFHPSGHL